MSQPPADAAPRTELWQVLRFAVVGGANTALMYAIYLLLLWLGVNYTLAVVADYAFGIVLGYLLHRHWTFRYRGPSPQSFLKYCVSYLFVFVVNLVLLVALVELLAQDAALAQIPALVIATLASYAAQRSWVFRTRA